jgi:hypothetical protein
MTTASDDEIINGYLAYYSGDKLSFWAFDDVCDLLSQDPERLWRITLCMISRTSDETTLAYIAAGPLEDIIAKHGSVFIDRVELIAKNDPQFFRALKHVWGHIRFKPEIYERIQKIIGTRG